MTIKANSWWKFFCLFSFVVLFLSACSDDDPDPAPEDPTDSIPDDTDSIPDGDGDGDGDTVSVPDAYFNFGDEGEDPEVTAHGIDTVEGRNGTDAYVFNAPDDTPENDTTECGLSGGDYVQLPTIGAIWEEGFTVAAWVQFEENRKFERIIDLGNGRGDRNEQGFNVTFSRFQASADLALTSWVSTDSLDNRGLGEGQGRLIARDVIANGEMQFYAATISPEGQMKIYVNGELVAEKANGHPVENVERTENYIGRSNWCEEDPDFKGTIDGVKLYGTVLSAEQIAALYEE